MLFQFMVQATITAQVARASQAALIVGPHMIEVTLLGWPTARPDPARDIPGDDQLGDPRRRPVRVRGKLMAAGTGLLVLPPPLGGRSGRPAGRCPCSLQDPGERGCRRCCGLRRAMWLL